jgi:hypothetical protein
MKDKRCSHVTPRHFRDMTRLHPTYTHTHQAPLPLASTHTHLAAFWRTRACSVLCAATAMTISSTCSESWRRRRGGHTHLVSTKRHTHTDE